MCARRSSPYSVPSRWCSSSPAPTSPTSSSPVPRNDSGEFSLRAALGAGHRRVMRQLLTESLLLATIGGVLGLAAALFGVRALIALSPPQLPRLDAIQVNGPVLAFALSITAIVGVAFGLAPAIYAARGDLYLGLRQSAQSTIGPRHLTRAVLVVSEVALALLLLVGSGLLVRSMRQLLAVSPGFEPSHLLTMQVQASGPRFADNAVTQRFFDQVLASVRQLPGVQSAAYTSQLPLSEDFDGYGVHIESKPKANPELDPSAHRYAVSTGYLETMKIPLLSGRTLTEADRDSQPAVVLVSETFARREWPNENPIGQRVRVGAADTGPWRTIVGVVGDVKQVSLSADQPYGIYLPESQWQFGDGFLSLVIRTQANPAPLTAAVRKAVWAIDRDQPIVRIATMDQLLVASTAQRKFILVLFEAFALVALLLAAAGIYGVLSGTVTERLREIGVRSALGATRGSLLLLVLRQGLGLTSVGVGIGLAAALASTRIISGLLFHVSGVDPLTYAAVTAMLVVVAFVACWIPAWRAARVDPMVTLRMD